MTLTRSKWKQPLVRGRQSNSIFFKAKQSELGKEGFRFLIYLNMYKYNINQMSEVSLGKRSNSNFKKFTCDQSQTVIIVWNLLILMMMIRFLIKGDTPLLNSFHLVLFSCSGSASRVFSWSLTLWVHKYLNVDKCWQIFQCSQMFKYLQMFQCSQIGSIITWTHIS